VTPRLQCVAQKHRGHREESEERKTAHASVILRFQRAGR
jgi:hypothetical protein